LPLRVLLKTGKKDPGMLVVREVYADGHADLTPAHLDYIRDMANRIGFAVVGQTGNPLGSVALIRLPISMRNPVFQVLVDDDVPGLLGEAS
jgi:hypothetical protein